jgi:hypothetical protein
MVRNKDKECKMLDMNFNKAAHFLRFRRQLLPLRFAWTAILLFQATRILPLETK